MNITVNGETKELATNATVSDLLAQSDVKMPDMVSVELNDTIIPRDQYNTQSLSDGDRVEFLYFMGGGAA